jgi:hypothetical protein
VPYHLATPQNLPLLLYLLVAVINNRGYTKSDMMHPIDRRELWIAELTLLAAAILQLTISSELRLGPKYMVSGLLILLLITVAFTAPRRHLGKGTPHITIAILLISLITLANAGELVLLINALLNNSDIGGDSLLGGAGAIFLTNIIVFGLLYWELDSPGLSGRRKRSTDDFQFPQEQNDSNWRPLFFDYLFVSITNSTAFSPTDTMPLTHVAKALMSVQALIALLTVVLVTARAVNILG